VEVVATRRERATLAAIILIAALFRWIGCTRESLWSDETFSGYVSTLPTFGSVINVVLTDVHPPGYFVSLWAWAQVFGSSEASLRGFSVLGGTLLVLVTYRLGKQLFSVETGLIAAFLSAFLIQGVYYSQEVRAYIWLAFLSAAAVSTAIDYVRTGSVWNLCLVVLATTLNSYSHYFGLMFSACIWLALVVAAIKLKRGLGATILGGTVSAAAFVPWISVALDSVRKPNWIPRPSLRYVAETFNIYFGPGIRIDALAFVVLLVGGVLLLSRKPRADLRREAVLVAWIVVPTAVSLVVSYLARPVFSPRNMILGMAAAVILLTRSVQTIGRTETRSWLLSIAFVLATYAIHLSVGNGYFTQTTKQQIREASQFILAGNTEQLPIYVVGWDKENFGYYFFGTRQASLLTRLKESEVKKSGFALVPEDRFWIASAGMDINHLTQFRQDYEIEKSGEYLLARAYLLRRKNRVH
jgi:uncharacterized membrane protein